MSMHARDLLRLVSDLYLHFVLSVCMCASSSGSEAATACGPPLVFLLPFMLVSGDVDHDIAFSVLSGWRCAASSCINASPWPSFYSVWSFFMMFPYGHHITIVLLE